MLKQHLQLCILFIKLFVGVMVFVIVIQWKAYKSLAASIDQTTKMCAIYQWENDIEFTNDEWRTTNRRIMRFSVFVVIKYTDSRIVSVLCCAWMTEPMDVCLCVCACVCVKWIEWMLCCVFRNDVVRKRLMVKKNVLWCNLNRNHYTKR